MTSKLTIALLAALCSTHLLAASPMPHIPHMHQDPGIDMPLPGFQQDPSYLWCGNALAILDEARAQARIAQSMGDPTSATRLLVNGLSQAAAAQPADGIVKPLTARAIARGPQLAAKVRSAVAGSLNGERTSAYFLFGYYDFITYVANDLDLPYYIPYQYCRHRHCGGYAVDATAFESRFVEYSKQQVQLVLNTLVETDGWQVFPVGPAAAYLHALEMSTAFAANDLSQSLWSARYACSRQELMRLSARLQRFNTSGGAYGGNPVIAVTQSYFEAQAALNSITPGCR